MSRRKWILNNNSDYNTVRTNGFCADIVKDLIREKRIILDHYEGNGFDHPKTIELLDNFFSRFASYTDNVITDKEMEYIDTLKTINTTELKTQMLDAATDATDNYIRDVLKGEDAFACGFAWVNIYPKFKGNTRDGKAERKVIRELGFELDYTGKRFSLWNPSKSYFQNIDCKEAGARAAAKVLESVGFEAYAGSRLD